MPHAILNGHAELPAIGASFKPAQYQQAGWILKLRGCYVSSDAVKLLVDCTAVRSGFAQDFYVRVEQKQDAVTVRVDPYMRIERNEGVQRCVLLIAGLLLHQQADRLSFEKSNLPPEILAELSGAIPK